MLNVEEDREGKHGYRIMEVHLRFGKIGKTKRQENLTPVLNDLKCNGDMN